MIAEITNFSPWSVIILALLDIQKQRLKPMAKLLPRYCQKCWMARSIHYLILTMRSTLNGIIVRPKE